MMTSDDQLSRHIYDLCALLLTILRGPALPPPPPPRRRVTPAGLASLLLGASLALMICGSVTLILGLILMPWVIAFVMLFYFAGIVANLSGIGRAAWEPAPAVSSPKEMSPGPDLFQTSDYLDMKW